MSPQPVNQVGATAASLLAIPTAVDPQILPYHQTEIWLSFIAGGSGAIIFLGLVNGLFALYRNIRKR